MHIKLFKGCIFIINETFGRILSILSAALVAITGIMLIALLCGSLGLKYKDPVEQIEAIKAK